MKSIKLISFLTKWHVMDENPRATQLTLFLQMCGKTNKQ